MNSQVYSVPGQTEGRKKAFLNWKSIDLSSKLSLTCEGNINYYKSFYHPLPTHEKGNILAIFKTNHQALLSIECPGRERSFLEDARSGTILWYYSQEYLVVIRDEKVFPFLRFEIILPLLCFLLDAHCRSWSSMINLLIVSRICQK